MSRCKQLGMSLVEMMVVLVILAMLLTWGATSFSRWIQNLKVRAAAESLIYGLQLARSEAIKRNALVYFSLVDKLGSGCSQIATGSDQATWNWIIGSSDPVGLACVDPEESNGIIQSRPNAEAGGDIRVNASLAALRFDGLGRTSTAAASFLVSKGGSAACSGDDQGIRCLSVVVSSPGGQIKLCDPQVTAASDPRKCD